MFTFLTTNPLVAKLKWDQNPQHFIQTKKLTLIKHNMETWSLNFNLIFKVLNLKIAYKVNTICDFGLYDRQWDIFLYMCQLLQCLFLITISIIQSQNIHFMTISYVKYFVITFKENILNWNLVQEKENLLQYRQKTQYKLIEISKKIKHHSSNKRMKNIFFITCKNDFQMSWTTDIAK